MALMGEKLVPLFDYCNKLYHTPELRIALSCTHTSEFGDKEDTPKVAIKVSHLAEAQLKTREEVFLLILITHRQNVSLLQGR